MEVASFHVIVVVILFALAATMATTVGAQPLRGQLPTPVQPPEGPRLGPSPSSPPLTQQQLRNMDWGEYLAGITPEILNDIVCGLRT